MSPTAVARPSSAVESTVPDVREPLTRAQAWIAGLLAGVRNDQLVLPTPCPEFDVDRLVRHLYGVADRMEAMGHGRPAESVPAFVNALPADVADGYRERTIRAQQSWVDDAALSRPVTAPWGTMPGGVVLAVYLTEHLTHGWDLAVATGQDAEADADLAELGLRSAGIAIPPEPRGGPMPFGPVVEPAPGAGPTERLANYLGRSWPRV